MMRIIGGHDYYDSAQAYGHDPNIVFVRDTTTLPKKTFDRPYADIYFVEPEKVKNHSWKDRHKFIQLRTGKWTFDPVYIIFCGKRYIGLKCEHEPARISENKFYVKEQTQVFWKKSELDAWSRLGDMVPIIKDVIGLRDHKNHLFSIEDVTGHEYSFLIKERISIAIYMDFTEQWAINSIGLKDLQFFRLFSATDAFQELDMWMSGALGLPGNPMVEVSDRDRMFKHGMDKWSFRKKVR
jgi:hypothetical protein